MLLASVELKPSTAELNEIITTDTLLLYTSPRERRKKIENKTNIPVTYVHTPLATGRKIKAV